MWSPQARPAIDVAEQFHRICEEMRQPFLDFVGEVGDLQDDRLGWLSSAFAWKDSDASDLFLLCCYLKLLELLVHEWVDRDETLVVIVEDRWLYEQARRSFSNVRGRIAFGGPAALLPTKLRCAIRGIAGRARWLAAILREYVSFAKNRRQYSQRQDHDCWLYSLPDPRCFEGLSGWKDPFLGNLDVILETHGHRVGRLVPTDPLGFGSQLAKRSAYVYPMLLQLSAPRLLRSLGSMWRARLKRLPRILGLDVSLLAKREWWMDLRRPTWCQHRLFYECARSAFEKHRPATVIFPYENQPWEKMLVAAAREVGVNTVGYQHSTVPRFLLAYFFGKREPSWSPLPDRILAAGPHQAQLLLSGLTPPDRVAVAGSLRYERRFKGMQRPSAIRSRSSDAMQKRILIVTAHDIGLATSLLDALVRAFPDGGETSGWQFFYRPHPTMAPIAHKAIASLKRVEGDLAPQLPTFDVVITTGTTVGLEACFLGLPVVKYRAPLLLDLDPLDALPEEFFLTASSEQLASRVKEAARMGRREISSKASALVDELFSDVDENVWLAAVDVEKSMWQAGSDDRAVGFRSH